MPAKQKRKAQDHTSQSNSKKHKYLSGDTNLTHDEIWDDSALIRSWEYALQEYRLYHSIHARGEDVEEVLRQAEAEQTVAVDHVDVNRAKNHGHSNRNEDVNDENMVEDGEISDGQSTTKAAPYHPPTEILVPSSPAENAVALDSQANVISVKDSFQNDSPNPGNSEARAANGKDISQQDEIVLTPAQVLENIKMSYYWAGYYSGMYDEQMKRSVG